MSFVPSQATNFDLSVAQGQFTGLSLDVRSGQRSDDVGSNGNVILADLVSTGSTNFTPLSAATTLSITNTDVVTKTIFLEGVDANMSSQTETIAVPNGGISTAKAWLGINSATITNATASSADINIGGQSVILNNTFTSNVPIYFVATGTTAYIADVSLLVGTVSPNLSLYLNTVNMGTTGTKSVINRVSLSDNFSPYMTVTGGYMWYLNVQNTPGGAQTVDVRSTVKQYVKV